MKPTKKIPDNYLHVATYDPHQYWKALWILFGIAALITIASFWLWSRLQTHETVGIQSLHRQNVNLGRITWAIFISLGLICIHELIHAALFWVYTKEWPKIAIRVYGIQVQGGEWFIPRNQFILINITPVALLSILGGLSPSLSTETLQRSMDFRPDSQCGGFHWGYRLLDFCLRPIRHGSLDDQRLYMDLQCNRREHGSWLSGKNSLLPGKNTLYHQSMRILSSLLQVRDSRQGTESLKSIILGGRDDYWINSNG